MLRSRLEGIGELPVYNGTGELRKVLLCPSTYYELVPVDDFARTAIERGDKVDHEKAEAQQNELVDIYRAAGIEVFWIEEPDPSRHYAVNARDFAVNSPRGFVLCRFKYSERRGEEVPGERQLRKLGHPIFGYIERGCWEGGDNKYIDDKNLASGTGERSTWPGIHHAQEILAKQGIRVHGIPIPPKWTHLDCLFAPVAPKLALILKSEVPDWFVGFLEGREYELIDLPVDKVEGEVALNVLCLGKDRVVSFKGNTLVNDILKSHGLTVYTPDLSEYTERGQGPHCLTCELDRDRE